ASGRPRHRLEHRPPARRRRARGCGAAARVLLQGAAAAGRAPRGRGAGGVGDHGAQRLRRRRAAGGRRQGLRGDAGVRHLRRARRHERRGRARPGPAGGERRHRRAPGRGRGTADVPRGPTVVRLVVGSTRGLRHRRRFAGDRRRQRRGPRRRTVLAAGSRAADPGVAPQGPARRELGAGPQAPGAHRDRPRRRSRAARRDGRPRGGDVEDVPLPGADLRGGAARRRLAGAAGPGGGRPQGQAAGAAGDGRRAAASAARGLTRPVPPDRGRCPGGRRGHGHLRPVRARGLSVGAARGDHPRAHRRDRHPV
ncbi:MAG: Exopolyphosphatase, partial [uncultured Nocardioidaceae bacterium]